MTEFPKHRLSLLLTALVAIGCQSDGPSNAASAPNPLAAKRPAPTAPPVVATGDTIRIGVVGAQTGSLKSYGDDEIAGAQLAVSEFNAAGGAGGKKVELLVGDSGSKPESAKSAAERLLDDGVIGIVGEVSSGNTAQIAQSAFLKSVPVVAVGATKTELSDIGSNVFRVCYTDDFQGPVMATFAYRDLGLRKVAVITDNKEPYSQGLSASFTKEFTRLGGQVLLEKSYESGQTQFGSQITELAATHAEAIFASGYAAEVGPIAQQARQAGFRGPLLGGDGWFTPQLVVSGGDAIVGSYFCNHFTNGDDRPEAAAFLTKWRAAHGGKEPGTAMAALGYDATRVVLEALKRTQPFDSKALTEAIADTTDFAGATGAITLKGRDGNPAKRAVVVEVAKPSGKGEWQKYAKAFTPDEIGKTSSGSGPR